MVDRPRPGRNVWKDDRPLGVGEELVVATCPILALRVPPREVTELHSQDARLDGVKPAVVPLDVVEVFPRLAVIAKHLAALRQSLVVSGKCDRFPPGVQIPDGIEADRGVTAPRA